MDLTSPEHDAAVHHAELHHRVGDTAALNAVRALLRAIDAERFAVEEASTTCWLVVDRWDYPQIVDRYGDGRAAQLDANRRNTLNIRDGQVDLRERLGAPRAVAGSLAVVAGGAV